MGLTPLNTKPNTKSTSKLSYANLLKIQMANPNPEPLKKKIMDLDPEIIQALTTQIKAQIMTTEPSSSGPKPINIGPFKLNPLPQNQSFRAKEPLTPEQQVLIDYSWNARNKTQLTMALHALAYYFHSKNITKTLPAQISQERFEPMTMPAPLLKVVKDLEISNTMMEVRLRELEEVEKENEQLRKWILQEKEREKEDWEQWRRFPHEIGEVENVIMEKLLKNYKNEQILYQEIFRRIGANEKQLFDGLTITAETYDPDETIGKGFSYLTCNIDCEEWKDVTIEGIKISLQRLLQLGLVNKMCITKKNQLKKIPIEKLVLIISEMLEKRKGIIECEMLTIPPSFEAQDISNAKSYITIRRMEKLMYRQVEIKDDELFPDSSRSIEDQIIHYRSMMQYKPYIIPPEYELVAETDDHKIFSRDYCANLRCVGRFAKIGDAHPKESSYYHKIKAYHMTKLLGDRWPGKEDKDDMSNEEGRDYETDVIESNIINNMEG